MARQVRWVLSGEAPADIPIETMSSPELVIDMRAAQRLGLDIPQVLRNAMRLD
jgi:ABC-type uncharacterized transport system substrate-binding protein